MPTKIFIVRHAQSIGNSQNKLQGYKNSALSPQGIEQAKALAQWFANESNEDITKIYTSDLLRANHTAQIIADFLNIPIEIFSQLREINLGDWEGMTPHQINKTYNNKFNEWIISPSSVKIPNAENMDDFGRRIINALDTICEKNKDKKLILVTHGGAIALILSYILKAGFDSFLLKIKLDNTGITVVERYDDGQYYILSINNTHHLSLVSDPFL